MGSWMTWWLLLAPIPVSSDEIRRRVRVIAPGANVFLAGNSPVIERRVADGLRALYYVDGRQR